MSDPEEVDLVFKLLWPFFTGPLLGMVVAFFGLTYANRNGIDVPVLFGWPSLTVVVYTGLMMILVAFLPPLFHFKVVRRGNTRGGGDDV